MALHNQSEGCLLPDDTHEDPLQSSLHMQLDATSLLAHDALHPSVLSGGHLLFVQRLSAVLQAGKMEPAGGVQTL